MTAVDVIRTKRDGGALSREQLAAFVEAAARGTWPDYQLAALLMACFTRGMTAEETAHLVRLMADSGKVLDLSDIPGPKVDKHSTGGVGDKTSLILAPLAAACGVIVPMMSGRGLGHTGGTLDKLESIPGFRVNLSEAEFRTALRTVGIGMIGQTADVAPADKKLYALRDVTGTVESVPLITASILSKKLAEGITGLVLDVKCGRGGFMKTLPAARELAASLLAGARGNDLECEALITDMNAPLGRAVGNANEVIECLDVLKGRGPADLAALSLTLATEMVNLAGIDDAAAKVKRALDSGAGVEKFRAMVAQQGGDPRIVDDDALLPKAPHERTIVAARGGFVSTVDAELVGRAGVLLGAGRQRAEDGVDPVAGILLRAKPGEAVRTGDAVFTVAYRRETAFAAAAELLATAYTIGDSPPPPLPPVLERLP